MQETSLARKRVQWRIHTCLNMTNMNLRDGIFKRNESSLKQQSGTKMATVQYMMVCGSITADMQISCISQH